VFVEGHSITFKLFGVPRHGGRLPFFPTQPGWISGVHQTGVRSTCLPKGFGHSFGWGFPSEYFSWFVVVDIGDYLKVLFAVD
ncbi:hypothetical protein, partial [Corynebacterium striatum]|uniref:hypothetical protein n=1 Tax=Corynebacterium striatum TaxID=43770 RepID=UPI003B5ADB95